MLIFPAFFLMGFAVADLRALVRIRPFEQHAANLAAAAANRAQASKA